MFVSEVFRSVGDESLESTELDSGTNGFQLEPRCRVCRNDVVRKQVNALLASGASYGMVLRALGDDNAMLDKRDRVTIDSIRNHTVRHFPVQNVAKATYREVLERRAEENGVDFVNGVATALTPIAFLEVVMNDAFRRLVDGDLDVSIDTGLRAAEKLQALTDARAGETDMAGVLVKMGRVIETVREFLPPEHWPALQARLRGEDVEQPQAQPVESIRVVDIDDSDDDEGNW
jgi:hypothetical protein